MDVIIHIVHRGDSCTVRAPYGGILADVVAHVGYPKAAQTSFRLWCDGKLIPFETPVNGPMEVYLTHVAMGNYVPPNAASASAAQA